MLAIAAACRTLGGWRLDGCTLFVTLEPCPMCTGAILQSRVERVVFGAFDPAQGCCGSRLTLSDEGLGSAPALYGGVLEEDCRKILTDFFARLRAEKQATQEGD